MNLIKRLVILCFLIIASVCYLQANSGQTLHITGNIILLQQSEIERDNNRITIKNFSNTDIKLLTEDGVYLYIPQHGGAILNCFSSQPPYFQLLFDDEHITYKYDLYPICGDSFVVKNQDNAEFEI